MENLIKKGRVLLCPVSIVATFAALGLFALALFPKIAAPLIHQPIEKISKYAAIMSFASLVTLCATLALAKILSSLMQNQDRSINLPEPNLSNVRSEKPKIVNIVALTIFVLIIEINATLQLKSPMDWDELDAATRMESPELYLEDLKNPYGNVDVISPAKNTRNHTISNLCAWASFKLFGLGVVQAHLPSLAFTTFFLVLISSVGAIALSTRVLLLTMSHLSVNAMFLWYTHSMRGYISMILFSSLCLLILLLTTKNIYIKPLSRTYKAWQAVLLFLSGIMVTLTHSFGGIFFIILMLSYLFWISLHSKNWPVAKIKSHLAMLGAGLLVMPITAYILVSQFLFLNKMGLLNSNYTPQSTLTFLSALGIGHTNVAGLLILFVAVLIVARWIQKEKIDFLSVFLFLNTLCLVFLITTLRASLFEPRFLLVFLLPLLFWISESIYMVKKSAFRFALTITFSVLFFALPLKNKSMIEADRTAHMGRFIAFINTAKKMTRDTPNHCISASGEKDQVLFTQGFFFKPIISLPQSCTTKFHFHYSKDWQGEHPLPELRKNLLTEIYRDPDGRIIYEKKGSTERII